MAKLFTEARHPVGTRAAWPRCGAPPPPPQAALTRRTQPPTSRRHDPLRHRPGHRTPRRRAGHCPPSLRSPWHARRAAQAPSERWCSGPRPRRCHGGPPQPPACAEGERGWPGAAPPPPRRPGRRGQAAWLRPGREPARAAARRPRRRAPGPARAGRRRIRPPWSAGPPPRCPRAGAAGRAPAGAQRAFGHAASHVEGGERHAGPAQHPQLQQCCSVGCQRSSRAAR